MKSEKHEAKSALQRQGNPDSPGWILMMMMMMTAAKTVKYPIISLE